MKVVVIGGGIGGLAVALFLAPRGHDITIVESDPMDVASDVHEAWAGWPRRGVTQFRNIHLFNARGRNLLRDRAPAVLRALQEAGAGALLLGGPGDDEMVRLLCRRTTYEWVLRRAVLDRRGVSVVGGTPVLGLLGDGRRVTGVRTADGAERAADLVVDASGRRSPLPAWMAAVGARPPEREVAANGSISYTRWYRLRSEAVGRLVQADLGYAAGIIAPADNGWFCVTFGCQLEDTASRALRHDAAFAAATAAIPRLAEWTHPDRATVESPVEVMADRANRLTRMAVDGAVPVAGVVALGDSAMCTNPSYGRGVGLALVHAVSLGAVLDEVGDADDAPQRVATAFAEATARELEPWYHAAVEADRVRQVISGRMLAGEPWEAVGAPGDDPAVRVARGASHAIERDPVVARAFHRAFQLLDPPSSFWGNPQIAERIEAVWQTLDRDPPPPAGPDHATMARLLAGAVPSAS